MPERTVAVVTDSSCGLDPDLAAHYGVCVVPVRVLSEGSASTEGVLTHKQVLEELEAGGDLRTEEPQVLALLSAFKDCAEAGAEHIVAVVADSSLSDALLAAESAAEDSPIPVTVVDSGTALLSLGLAVLAAGAVSLAGGTPEETEAASREVADNARMWLTADSLDHVRRTGLVPELVAELDEQPESRPVVLMTKDEKEQLDGAQDLLGARESILELAQEEARTMHRPVALLGGGRSQAEEAESESDLAVDGRVIVATPSIPLLVNVGPSAFNAAVADMPEAFFAVEIESPDLDEESLALAS